MKNYCKYLLLMLIPTISISIVSCGDSDDEPDNPTSNSIIGVWEAPNWSDTSYDFLNLKSANVYAAYDFWNNNYNYSKDTGYYYYDSTTGLMTIHYDFNRDCDIYKVVTLTESDMVICWIEDVSERYTSNTFDASADQAVINQICKEGFELDTDDYEFFEKSSESRLNSLLKDATEE